MPSTDSAALARGGRTNFFGFLLRLSARFPFLILAARLYGAEELGRFAYATMVAEFAAALAVLGLKRGLAQEMARGIAGSEESGHMAESHVLADALTLGLGLAFVATLLLLAVPVLLYPDGMGHPAQILLALVVPFIVISDITLAALAFRHRIGAAVTARSVVEPWVLAGAAVALALTPVKHSGLLLAYFISLAAAAVASVRPAMRMFDRPRGWRPSLSRCIAMARRNIPLAGAEIIEWTTRRLDIFILGRFVSAEVVGIYYVAQQVASLAGKVRSSFDPILAPMLSTALHNGNRAQAAGHVRQVGFWLIAFQLPIVLALGLPAEGILGLFGPEFAVGGLVLALLLLAELAGANASLSEMALIYARPRRNLLISIQGLALQAALSFALVPFLGGVGAALALALSMVVVGIAKLVMLGRALDAPVNFWRPSLLLAALPAIGLGLAARSLPELPQMLVTIPGVLILFAFIIWRFGFGPDDRLLFAGAKKARR
ncbi:MAG: lipopolysaccharide biosynthesis protein [Sphingomonadaceae bacterium]